MISNAAAAAIDPRGNGRCSPLKGMGTDRIAWCFAMAVGIDGEQRRFRIIRDG
jgi:hypothetical protein